MHELVVEFDRSTQSLGALKEAAYRLIRTASCQIEATNGRYLCRLIPKEEGAAEQNDMLLRSTFFDLVTDENLREKISAETTPVRNVIMALAFGSLVSE